LPKSSTASPEAFSDCWCRLWANSDPARLALTLAFLFGRLASWERLAADYNVFDGGLLPSGMVVLMLSLLIAGKVRGVVS
jgi:hypothetical protein